MRKRQEQCVNLLSGLQCNGQCCEAERGLPLARESVALTIRQLVILRWRLLVPMKLLPLTLEEAQQVIAPTVWLDTRKILKVKVSTLSFYFLLKKLRDALENRLCRERQTRHLRFLLHSEKIGRCFLQFILFRFFCKTNEKRTNIFFHPND